MSALVNGASFNSLLPRMNLATPPVVGHPVRPVVLTGAETAAGLALLGLVTARTLSGPTGAGLPMGMPAGMSISGLPSGVLGCVDAQSWAVLAALAGVNAGLVTGRARVRRRVALPAAGALAVRAFILGALGLALGYSELSLGAVILPYYATLFLLAIPLVFLPTWGVGGIGLMSVGAVPVLTHYLLPRLPLAPGRNPVLADLPNQPLDLLSQLALTGTYPALAALAAVCAGVVVARLGAEHRDAGVLLLAAGLWLVTMAGTTSWLLTHRFGAVSKIWQAAPSGVLPTTTAELLSGGGPGTTPAWSWWWLAVAAPHTGSPPELLGTTGGAIALLGLIVLVDMLRPRPLRALLTGLRAPLAGLGAIAASAYTGHVLFVNSDYAQLAPRASLALQVVVGLLIGLVWRLTAGRDPLETLVPSFIPVSAPAVRDRHV